MCGVNKSAFAGVAKKTALADTSDENVREAVVIVVADGYAHTIEFDVEAGGVCYVRECAVAIVAVKAKGGTLAFVRGPVHAVDKQYVLPAIAVVIEKRAAGPQSFGE
jgi:hypothetical protein